MKHIFLIIACSLAGLVSARATEAIEIVREGTDQVIGVLTAEALQGPEHRTARREQVKAVIDSYFDWERMAQSCLGQHWRTINAEQQTHFIKLFSQLLEATYMGKVDGYEGETVTFDKQQVNSSKTRARVYTTVVTSKRVKVSLVYSLHHDDGRWQVYDIMVEGVRLVDNYRKQFTSVLRGKSFDELLDVLEARVAKLKEGDEA